MKILKFLIKSLWGLVKFLIKEIASFIIKGCLLLFIIAVIVAASIKEPSESKKVAQPGTFIRIDMSQKYNESVDYLPKFLVGDRDNFYGLLKKLSAIKEDKNVSGLLLDIDDLPLSNAQIEELSKKLEELKKSGKHIISYAENMDNRNYTLALSGNEIIMPHTETAGVNITGYYTELGYYKGLADKIGVDFNVIHVGDYKAFGENYTRKTMSKEYRDNITELKDRVYQNFVNKIIERRDLLVDDINGDILAGKLVNGDVKDLILYGMLNDLKDESTIISEIGRERVMNLDEYDADIKEMRGDKIAVIYAEGEIRTDGGENQDIINSITPGKIIEQLNTVMDDNRVKGIVLRVNSPGGSALASNLIYQKLLEVGKKKPIYISIGGVAASGGYYISCAGEKIFADKESITGSIGVVSIIPNFRKLLGKADVNMEIVKKGKYSDLYSFSKEFTEDDRKKIYEKSLKVYKEFLGVVVDSRNRGVDYIDSIAQGRVWLGEQGKELGLVDEIGGLEDTIKALAASIDLEEYEVVEIVQKPKLNAILKNNIPLLKNYFKIETLINDKELYFKPLYYFPYKI